MFRYLTILFLAIWAFDRAAFMLSIGRAKGPFGIVFKRKVSPLGYWTITALWCACAAAALAGLVFLTYCGLTGAGPYKEHAFFSMDQAWPLALLLIPGTWLTFVVLRGWVAWLRSRRPHNAA